MRYRALLNNFSWNFFSQVIIISYCLFQAIRWPVLPQFMDIYYHLLTAWGFIQANGYVGWDFWQYAPVGRIHIYPPVFHIILALLIKLGINKVILAKFFEAVVPAVFLAVLWRFTKKIYSERIAFFVIVAFSSSFSFYLSLINHIPATLSFLFGLLAFEQLFGKNMLRSLLLLTLCFYTHIGIAWFFALSFLIYALLEKQHRTDSLLIFITALILSMPILIKQIMGLRFITSLGINLNERYNCQIKIFDYILAFFGLIALLKQYKRYKLFFSFLLSSLIFLSYPYRFFSAEGYFPIILLIALLLDSLYEKLNLRYLCFILAFFILFISPTLSLNRTLGQKKIDYKLNFTDSAFLGMLFARGQIMWYPREYIPAASIIKDNSQDTDIVYSTLNVAGMALSSISGRATANGLLAEIGPIRQFDHFAVSKIIVFTQDDGPDELERIVNIYRLVKIGENKLFIFYKNPSSQATAAIKKTSVPFKVIMLIGLLFVLVFWQAGRIRKVASCLIKR